MPVLGLDTSTRSQSVALASGGKILSHVEVPHAVTHSRTILGAVDQVLAAAHLRPRDLSAIAVASGPGSFTGLRIGMATAKGLALAAGVPLAGFSTLALLARALAASHTSTAPFDVCALIDAGRGQIYMGLYRAGPRAAGGTVLAPLAPETACAPEEVLRSITGGSVVGGDGAIHHRERLTPLPPGAIRIDPTPPLAPSLALLAEEALRASRLSDHPLVPNYVRPPEALRAAPA